MFVPVEQLAGKSIGQYKLTKLIGRSALSAVYEAATSEQASPVMLTVFRLPDECVGEAWELFMERFEDEASQLRMLQHPHVVPFYEFGEEFGYPYLITPLTANQTLADLLRQSACTPIQTLHLLKQIAAGLDYVHTQGIVHGSLKPSNILIRIEQEQPRVLIANVGLAQILQMDGIGQVSHSHPHLFSVAGTLLTNPAYLAPEVVRGAPSDARSDMYALGILVYEMLCGRPPFTGSDPIAVALQHVDQTIPPLSSFKPELPQALDGTLRSVLERDPARRIQSAEQLAKALERTVNALPKSSKGIFAAARQNSNSMMGKSAQLEQQWQGMPGVTGDKMPSLVPEFMAGAGAGGATRRTLSGQFKLPSSGALPPVPRAAAPDNPVPLPPSGPIFKPRMTLGSGTAFSAPSASKPEAAPVQPPAAQTPLVTVIASGTKATQAAMLQNNSTEASPVAVNGYGAQMAASPQYAAPGQAYPMQGPDANAAGWTQMPNGGMAAAANMGTTSMQAGGMYPGSQYAQQYGDPSGYIDPQYSQQQYGDGYGYVDPQYAQQQYGEGYGYGQEGWAQHEQELEPVPDKGRRRAVLIVGGAVAAAVLGAGSINLLRMMRQDNTAQLPAGNANNTTQPPAPTTGQQKAGQAPTAPANQKGGTVIANQKNVALNATQDFTNPIDKHPAILVHLPNGKFAAYDKACTHQGVAVAYDPQTKMLVCPLHHSIFDPANNGAVVHGPAFLRLPAVPIHVNADGTITAG